jgi:predicted CxxxxCH...CXXCH cytochrome family protein
MRHALIVLQCAAACGTLRDDPRPVARIHAAGFADPSAADNHVGALRALNYPLPSCATCHGADFAGTANGPSCRTCHSEGPTACNVCHALPPATGAHPKHARYACETCHPVPAAWDAAGHLDGVAPAEVRLAGLAAARGANPGYSVAGCSSTYCHGPTSHVSWTAGPGAADCGTCHSIPPPNHHGNACEACHGEVVNRAREIVAPARHVDGRVDVRDLSAGCSACHGPPADLGGAHTAHLSGRTGKALECADCHVVPQTIAAPAHLDGDGRAEIVFGARARADSSTPLWNGASCTGTYCHGATLRGAATPEPAWSGGGTQAACGACHGVPYPNHHGEVCSDCHGAVVDRAFRILRPDLHINGRVELGSAP